MKILYAIQGTGNGHLSRARDIIPLLEKYGKLDLFVSGTQSEVKLPHKVHYYSEGFSYFHNHKGGIDMWATYRRNRLARVWADIVTCPVEKYDLIVNDFEPITAWACRYHRKPCIALGHQASFLSENTPRPEKRSPFGELVLKQYAPAQAAIGFHFDSYDSFIFSPVVRQQIRRMTPRNLGHHTVYLPGLDDANMMNLLGKFPDVRWEVFSKYAERPYVNRNVSFRPVDNQAFMQSLADCEGILTGAGFETPAEALFLGKKLFVIPLKGQYEQQCNAEALRRMGVPVAWKITDELPVQIACWLNEKPAPARYFPNTTQQAVESMLTMWENMLPAWGEVPSFI